MTEPEQNYALQWNITKAETYFGRKLWATFRLYAPSM